MTDIAPIAAFVPGTFSGERYELPENISRDDWFDIGRMLNHVSENVQPWIGHWWNQGTRRYGDFATPEAKQELKERTGFAYNTVRMYGATLVDEAERVERARMHDPSEERFDTIVSNLHNAPFWARQRVAHSGLPDVSKNALIEGVVKGEIPKTHLALGDAISAEKRTIDLDAQMGTYTPAPVDAVDEQYMVVIDCDSEQQQRQLLRRFLSEGLRCRALTV